MPDLPWYMWTIIFVSAAFLWGFFEAAGEDFYHWGPPWSH